MLADGERPYVIGLTGNIATGKSTVLAYLAQKGAHVVDADKLAHKTLEPDGAAYGKVLDRFGNTLLDEAGRIDRARLAEIVFADPQELARLEEIVHPATFELLRWNMTQSRAEIVILEAIKLLESGRMLTLSDEIWVVTSHPDAQLRRMMDTRGMTEEEARRRMAVQSSQAIKMSQADQVIINDGSLDDLYAQLDQLWQGAVTRARQAQARTE